MYKCIAWQTCFVMTMTYHQNIQLYLGDLTCLSDLIVLWPSWFIFICFFFFRLNVHDDSKLKWGRTMQSWLSACLSWCDAASHSFTTRLILNQHLGHPQPPYWFYLTQPARYGPCRIFCFFKHIIVWLWCLLLSIGKLDVLPITFSWTVLPVFWQKK